MDDRSGKNTLIPADARTTAANCRHYAMCKIDFLGTGLCPAGKSKHYVSYYPQGRMDLCFALANGSVPVTERLADIAATCNLCGICDKQCHFVTGMRPLKVMKALNEVVSAHLRAGGRVERADSDPFLESLKKIVGTDWATNDQAVLLTYSNDPFPLAPARMPRYVVLPRTTEEIVEIVRLADRHKVPFVVRGNGGSVFGIVFTEGVVIDTERMKGIQVDIDNWLAVVEPGVTSFELQQEAAAHGLRVNAAEPAATVCGNIICTGMFSTWANVYGVGADNFADMEFVDSHGRLFRLGDKAAPNVFGFENRVCSPPGVCVKASVRMHPTTDDEEGLLVPFASFSEAVSFARELSARRIGLAIGVLGGHYMSTFMSPSAELANRVKACLTEALGIQYAVFVVGDRHAREVIGRMAGTVMDESLMRTLMLGLPRLVENQWLDLVRNAETDAPAFQILLRQEARPLLEAVLRPSPETAARAVDEDLREFYVGLYSRPEMTNLRWLNTFRIVSSRMARHKHVFVFVVYVPLDKTAVIEDLVTQFGAIAERNSISHDYGFLTPLDLGKRGILEYDYYIDQTDPAEAERIGNALSVLDPMLDELASRVKGIKSLKYIFAQGCSRKENFLYS